MNRARREETRKNAELRKARERARANHAEVARRIDAAEAALRDHNDRAASASRAADGDVFLSVVKERSPVLVVPELMPVLRLDRRLRRLRHRRGLLVRQRRVRNRLRVPASDVHVHEEQERRWNDDLQRLPELHDEPELQHDRGELRHSVLSPF